MPKRIILGAHEVGTGGHLQASILAESMMEKYPGLEVRVLPEGVETGRSWLVRLGDVHTQYHPEDAVVAMQEGTWDYNTLQWGPQPVRDLFLGQHPGCAVTVRGDSNIYTLQDIKGRTVAFFPGSLSASANVRGWVALAGYTMDDVVLVDYPSPAAAYQAVIDGKLDVTWFNVTSPKLYELAASPAGVRFLPMPASATEGWKRLKEAGSAFHPRLITRGGGIDAAHPVEGETYAYPTMHTYDSLDVNTAYWITKGIVESYDIFSKKDESMAADWTLEATWRLWDAGVIPMHEGAIRYYKGIGDWTPQREAMNNERLKHQADLKKLWDDTVNEALTKAVKATAFPNFWMEKRAAAGFK